MRRRMIGAATAAGLALALAACGGGGPGAEDDGSRSGDQGDSGTAQEVEFSERVTRGAPEGIDWARGGEIDGEPVAGWIVEGESFAVVTWGSSSCPPVAAKLLIQGGDRIELGFENSPNEICTADMAPTTQEFDLPAGVSERPVTLVLRFEGGDGPLTFTLE